MADASSFAPPSRNEPDQAAGGRPFGVGSYGSAAPTLLDHGYEPLPIKPASKAPAPSRWSSLLLDEAQVGNWAARWPGHGVGLRTGRLVGIDIDLLDADLAHQAERIARERLGETPLARVGRWPKRLLVYRAEQPFPKIRAAGVEVLGRGQQFVAFGIHPDTGQPYDWPLGETPLDVALEDLPVVDRCACEEVVAEIAALSPAAPVPSRGPRSAPGTGAGPMRGPGGRVADGRDGWLSSIAFHAVHDQLDARAEPDQRALADLVWRRFAATADLDRPRQGGGRAYSEADAARKVADKLRLLREGRLPPRRREALEADYELPNLEPDGARRALDEALRQACADVEAWHAHGDQLPCPQIGIRATVGLGKSARTRWHVLALRERLRAAGRPDRVIVFTPSHALAEETAGKWREAGVRVAVLRGYEAREPVAGGPMCQDIEAVRAAILAGEDVQSTACARQDGRRCRFIDACAKQRNRREVAEAEIVVAAYDALYTGFAIEAAAIGLLVIDEGCWARARFETRDLWVETFAADHANAFRGASRRAFERQAADLADLVDLRSRAFRALSANGPGPVRRTPLTSAGLGPDDCRLAAGIEEKRLRDPGLYPGMPKLARAPAIEIARKNAGVRRQAAFWRALASLLDAGEKVSGRLRIEPPHPKSGLHELVLGGVKSVHPNFRGVPVLHLDATLRPALARRVLPDLKVTEVEAAMPHARLGLVVGSFGKSTLCPGDTREPDERRRRERRLAECVDHVRWQARRVAPGRVLVVTYKSCEAAFAGIPGVCTGHFNAIAGLDAYKDVRLLVVIGRPLPAAQEVRHMAAAYFGMWPGDRYERVRKGVRMRDGSVRGASVLRCRDDEAESLRAAICDDEVIQAIGRGRGVNRAEGDPLEVQVLADVALPLVHNEVRAWETLVPDLFQRMLLDGLAVDSPGDAAALHAGLVGEEKQAQKAFERMGFKRQIPIGTSYREMSLKSAAYRRPGRGRSWQRAWWIAGDPDPRSKLEAALGPLAGWRPH